MVELVRATFTSIVLSGGKADWIARMYGYRSNNK